MRHVDEEPGTRGLRAVPVRKTAARAAAVLLSTALVSTALVSTALASTALARGVPGPASALAASQAPARPGAEAVIRRTAGGVPHILARNWASLGFGYGFAFAQDSLCTMANDYVTVEAQQVRYFGPKGSYDQRANGSPVTNLDSDLFFRQIIDSRAVQHFTRSLDPRVRQIEAGYVQGYNRYLASVGGARGVPDPTCRGQAWVRPITVRDTYLRFYQLMLESSQDAFIDSIAQAAPPKAASPKAVPSKAAVSALTDPRRAAGGMRW